MKDDVPEVDSAHVDTQNSLKGDSSASDVRVFEMPTAYKALFHALMSKDVEVQLPSDSWRTIFDPFRSVVYFACSEIADSTEKPGIQEIVIVKQVTSI